MNKNKKNNGAMSHNACYDKKFLEYLRQYFKSYFEYVTDLNGRVGLTRMFRKSLVVLFDINPVISLYSRENGDSIIRLGLVSKDGRVDFGYVKACFDGFSISVDFNGIK